MYEAMQKRVRRASFDRAIRRPGDSVVARLRHRIFFFQAEDGIRDYKVTGVQTCALPICIKNKAFMPLAEFAGCAPGILEDIQRTLLARAAAYRDANTVKIDSKDDFYEIGRASCRERV